MGDRPEYPLLREAFDRVKENEEFKTILREQEESDQDETNLKGDNE